VAEETSRNWTVKVSSKAEKYLVKLGKPTKERVKQALLALSVHEDPLLDPNVKPLLGPLKGFYRLRIGTRRVIFALIKEQHIIAVVNIAPRGDVYK
jgi:mRNA interferase RelE/StbE